MKSPLQRPVWYRYAQEEALPRLMAAPKLKSGRKEAAVIGATWMIACREKGYEGTEADWKYLLDRLWTAEVRGASRTGHK